MKLEKMELDGILILNENYKCLNTDDTELDENINFSKNLYNATDFIVNLIEVSDVQSISEISIEIKTQFENKKVVQFSKIRDKFIFENGLFHLNTKDLDDFKLNINQVTFYIKTIYDRPFTMKLYYTILKNVPAKLF